MFYLIKKKNEWEFHRFMDDTQIGFKTAFMILHNWNIMSLERQKQLYSKCRHYSIIIHAEFETKKKMKFNLAIFVFVSQQNVCQLFHVIALFSLLSNCECYLFARFIKFSIYRWVGFCSLSKKPHKITCFVTDPIFNAFDWDLIFFPLSTAE